MNLLQRRLMLGVGLLLVPIIVIGWAGFADPLFVWGAPGTQHRVVTTTEVNPNAVALVVGTAAASLISLGASTAVAATVAVVSGGLDAGLTFGLPETFAPYKNVKKHQHRWAVRSIPRGIVESGDPSAVRAERDEINSRAGYQARGYSTAHDITHQTIFNTLKDDPTNANTHPGAVLGDKWEDG